MLSYTPNNGEGHKRLIARLEKLMQGWLERLLTHPVQGLENWKLLLHTLTTAKGAIKVYCEVANE